MKKRLRKKLRLWEFQEMGFHVHFELSLPHTDEANFAFTDKLIDMIEANQLQIGGSIIDFFTCVEHRHTATEAHREVVQQWLEQQPEVSVIAVGPLVDAWHGSFN